MIQNRKTRVARVIMALMLIFSIQLIVFQVKASPVTFPPSYGSLQIQSADYHLIDTMITTQNSGPVCVYCQNAGDSCLDNCDMSSVFAIPYVFNLVLKTGIHPRFFSFIHVPVATPPQRLFKPPRFT